MPGESIYEFQQPARWCCLRFYTFVSATITFSRSDGNRQTFFPSLERKKHIALQRRGHQKALATSNVIVIESPQHTKSVIFVRLISHFPSATVCLWCFSVLRGTAPYSVFITNNNSNSNVMIARDALYNVLIWIIRPINWNKYNNVIHSSDAIHL